MTATPLPAARPSRRRAPRDTILAAYHVGAAAVGSLTTVGIVLVLAFETLAFFSEVSPIDYFTGTRLSANIQPYGFGVLPLVVSTLMIALIAVVIAVPLGLLAAVWLAEYAGTRTRNIVKPVLEVLAGIPTIVYGFFAITVVTPFLQS
ncbi:MAG: PstC family ABC transporter permease, partial [Chloroflexota bacterium]